jgi:hypothetical protein
MKGIIRYSLALLSAAITLVAAEQLEDGFELRRLSDDSFQPSVAKGLW